MTRAGGPSEAVQLVQGLLAERKQHQAAIERIDAAFERLRALAGISEPAAKPARRAPAQRARKPAKRPAAPPTPAPRVHAAKPVAAKPAAPAAKPEPTPPAKASDRLKAIAAAAAKRPLPMAKVGQRAPVKRACGICRQLGHRRETCPARPPLAVCAGDDDQEDEPVAPTAQPTCQLAQVAPPAPPPVPATTPAAGNQPEAAQPRRGRPPKRACTQMIRCTLQRPLEGGERQMAPTMATCGALVCERDGARHLEEVHGGAAGAFEPVIGGVE